MPSHSEKKILPFSAAQLFDLVADVEHYPAFLPWVNQASVSDRKETKTGQIFTADVVMGYKLLTYPYRCYVHLHTRENRVDIEYIEGPFSHLTNYWIFRPLNDQLTELTFYIDFDFQSPALRLLLHPLLDQVVHRMTLAFDKRAHQIYG